VCETYELASYPRTDCVGLPESQYSEGFKPGNRLHGSLDVSFNKDRARAYRRNAGHKLARVQRMAPTLLRQDTTRQTGIKTQPLLAGISDTFRANLLGFQSI
jgi:hypothetical protein